MKIADEIIKRQDIKEMTRNAIKMLLRLKPGDPEGIELSKEFLAAYGEPVEEESK